MKKNIRSNDLFLKSLQVIVNSVFFEIPLLIWFRIAIYRMLFPIGSNFHIGWGTIFFREQSLKGKIEIGNNVSIETQVLLDYSGGCRIGNNVCISHRVAVFSHEHPFINGKYQPFRKGVGKKLFIGNDVWIGFQAIVLPSVHHIGNGAVIGAGSVVTKNVPEHCLVAGNPAHLIRHLT